MPRTTILLLSLAATVSAGPLLNVFTEDLKINTKMIGYLKSEKTSLIEHAKLSKEYYFEAKHLVHEEKFNAKIITSTPQNNPISIPTSP